MEQEQPKTVGALERLEICESELKRMRQVAQRDGTSFQYIAQKLLLLEQSLAGVAKTLAAVTEEMIEKTLISDESVMARIRKIDEDQEKERVKGLKEGNIIVPGSLVQPSSLAILSQKLIKADGKVEILSNFRTLEMPRLNPQDAVYLNALGKKVDEQFVLDGHDAGDQMIFTVKEIYELAPQGGNQVAQPATPVPAQTPVAQPATEVSSQPDPTPAASPVTEAPSVTSDASTPSTDSTSTNS
jgi:hypothetical protein